MMKVNKEAITSLVVLLVSVLMKMYLGWELIFPMLLSIPILLYVKSNEKMWRIFYTWFTFDLLLRLTVIAIVSRVFPGIVDYPITINEDFVLNLCGMLSVVSWIVWILVLMSVSVGTVKHVVRHCKTLKEVSNNSTITRMQNLFTISVIVVCIMIITTTFAYKLQDYDINLVIFVGCVLMLLCAHHLYIINILRQRKEEILLEEKESNPTLFEAHEKAKNVKLNSEEKLEVEDLGAEEMTSTE